MFVATKRTYFFAHDTQIIYCKGKFVLVSPVQAYEGLELHIPVF